MSTIVGLNSLQRQLPTASIDLRKEEAKAARAFKPGQIVRVTLIGTITRLSLQEADDPDETGFEGNLGLDLQDMVIGISQKNAIAELLDDDE